MILTRIQGTLGSVVVANDNSGSFALQLCFRCKTDFLTLILTTPISIQEAEPMILYERIRARYFDNSTLEQKNTLPSNEKKHRNFSIQL